MLAPSGAASDGIEPNRVGDHALRGDWQFKSMTQGSGFDISTIVPDLPG